MTASALPGAFWRKVDWSAGPDACWPWLGNRGDKGYGRLRADGAAHYAHRLSLSLALGRPLAPGMQALHHCDNPPCVNPMHLYEGTRDDNRRDAVERDRMQRGQLTCEQVAFIRRSGWRPLALAVAYHVSVRTIYRALTPRYRAIASELRDAA